MKQRDFKTVAMGKVTLLVVLNVHLCVYSNIKRDANPQRGEGVTGGRPLYKIIESNNICRILPR